MSWRCKLDDKGFSINARGMRLHCQAITSVRKRAGKSCFRTTARQSGTNCAGLACVLCTPSKLIPGVTDLLLTGCRKLHGSKAETPLVTPLAFEGLQGLSVSAAFCVSAFSVWVLTADTAHPSSRPQPWSTTPGKGLREAKGKRHCLHGCRIC
jgi:hypothetical protein